MLEKLNRQSFLFKKIRTIDSFWISFNGYLPDFEKLDWVYDHRPLFSKEGLIKISVSMIPGQDSKLKKLCKKYGGWERLLNITPDEALYAELESVGFNRTDYDLTRLYLSNPKRYRDAALERKRKSNDSFR